VPGVSPSSKTAYLAAVGFNIGIEYCFFHAFEVLVGFNTASPSNNELG
jgi:hypothetical protein